MHIVGLLLCPCLEIFRCSVRNTGSLKLVGVKLIQVHFCPFYYYYYYCYYLRGIYNYIHVTNHVHWVYNFAPFLCLNLYNMKCLFPWSVITF